MKIIVVGCGKIGTMIISSLVAEGHELIAIDSDLKTLNTVKNLFDIMAVCANGADAESLIEAGVQKAEMFIACTGSDELNMLSCFFARKLGAKFTIARIRNSDYNDRSLSFIRQTLELSMSINPEDLASKELFNILKLPSAAKIETFSSRNIEMIELRIKANSPLDGMSLSELRTKYKERFLICAVQRGSLVFIPDGNFILKSGDKIGITAAPSQIAKLMKAWNTYQKQIKNVIILGGSRTAVYLAKRLLNAGNSVKIIEQNSARAKAICELLPGIKCSLGDGTQQELLTEEGIDGADAFVTLTGVDEENILISYFASSRGVPKVISKVNRDELISLAEQMGLDSIVSPKNTVANIIVQYARAVANSVGSKVETLYKLMDSNIEALEFTVSTDFRGLQTPLKELHLREGILLAGIIRGRKTIIPGGDDVILIGDKVIVIASGKRLNDLSEILR